MLSQDLNHWFIGLVFSSTLFIYSLHRVVGLNKLKKDSQKKGRYITIINYKNHILVYTVISILVMVYCLSHMELWTLVLFIPAGIVSTLYTLPVFGEGKRLRDFNFIKILLIALVWAYVASVIPMHLMNNSDVPLTILSFSERFVYLLLITLPFDVRDLDIDKSIGVKTLPAALGLSKTKVLIDVLCGLGLVCLLLMYGMHLIDFKSTLALALVYLLSWLAINWAWNKASDYYYSGLLDGLLIVRGLFVLGSTIL